MPPQANSVQPERPQTEASTGREDPSVINNLKKELRRERANRRQCEALLDRLLSLCGSGLRIAQDRPSKPPEHEQLLLFPGL